MKISSLLCLLIVFTIPAFSSEGITIAEDGSAKATIILGDDATPQERTAANELSYYLKKSTGADFKISDVVPIRGNKIFIGQTKKVKELMGNFDWTTVGRDGILIKTIGPNLILSGDRPRGSIYAVICFLEDYLGIRWWAPDAESVPTRKIFVVGNIDKTHTPPFMYREAFFQPPNTDTAFAMHMKLNGHHQPIPAEQGGHYSILGWCHTFYSLLRPDAYFSDHPEWFSMIDGKRTADWGQLCLSNVEMKNEFVKNVIDWIDKDPDAGIISVSQNDWYNPCQCDNCKELVKNTGGESGALISFVNSVAAEVEKKYPNFLVETLAYQYTRSAPTNIKPRHNVIVRLCSIECNFGQPLDSKANESFYNDIKAWKSISERLYVWDYVVNFSNYYIIHPNFHNLAANIRLFADNNVVGLFEQGDAFNPTSALNQLKSWMLAKLMWDPSLDDKALIKEFMDGYFGLASKNMQKYLNVFIDAVKRENPNLRCYIPKPEFYNKSDLQKAIRYMKSAMIDAKNDPILLDRVRKQKISLDALLINQKKKFDISGESITGVDWNNIADELFNTIDSSGNLFPSEGYKINDQYKQMLRKSLIIPKQLREPDPPASGVKGKDWLDFQESMLILANEGVWVTVDNDADASNGLTCVMPGGSTQWAVQKPITKNDIISDKVDVIASIKVKASGTEGLAIRFGVYDPDVPIDNFINIPVSEVKNNKYNEYRISNVSLKKGMYIYVAPCGNGVVDNIAVDRIYINKIK